MEDSETPPIPLGSEASPKLLSGFLLILPFEKARFKSKWERNNYYWKDGIKHDVHRWLRHNIGARCVSLHLWDNENLEDGEWIFLGSQIRKKSRVHTITLRFRTKAQAMLFKLTWAGQL